MLFAELRPGDVEIHTHDARCLQPRTREIFSFSQCIRDNPWFRDNGLEMTKPWRVDVLQCRGSSYDVGKQIAEGFRLKAGLRRHACFAGDEAPEARHQMGNPPCWCHRRI